MSAVLSDISFLCFLFTVTRLSLCKSGEKRESLTHIFARDRKACCFNKHRAQGCTDDKRLRGASEGKPFDIVKPHVTLARVEWVVLREDCLAQRTPFGPEGNCCVPTAELQINGQLVCT